MVRFLSRSLLLFALMLAGSPLFALPAAPDLALPSNLSAILDHIYSGRSDLAVPEIHQLEQQSPDHPLPYLLEAEAEWWSVWCTSAEFKFGMTMARRHEKSPADQHYLELATKAYALAEAKLRQHDSAEMHLYEGMADALASRMYSLRGEYRATARVGVRARENFLKALALDPSLADAYTGLGLYNYYVDTLSAVARVLRFVMGIPGGSKEEGVHQLERAIRDGKITPPVARFYLAINLENYDQHYEMALRVMEPLVNQYPQNPVFLLVRGDLYAKLGRKPLAEASYRAALAAANQLADPGCRLKLPSLVQESLAALASH